MHLYGGQVRVGERNFQLGVFVRETLDGTFHYDLTKLGVEVAGSRSLLTDGKSENLHQFGIAPGELNLMEIGGQRNSDARGVFADLQARLASLNLDSKVQVAVQPVINGDPRIAGAYRERLITVALASSSQSAEMTFDHEAVHALKALGLFNTAEWNALTNEASRDTALMTSIRQRYQHLSAKAQIEEAVADLFMRYRAGQEVKGFAHKALDRIRDFLRGLGLVLRGEGFTTAASVMRAIGRGEIGGRPASAYFDAGKINNSDAPSRSFSESGPDPDQLVTIVAAASAPLGGTFKERRLKTKSAARNLFAGNA